jgi:hypothetical protein
VGAMVKQRQLAGGYSTRMVHGAVGRWASGRTLLAWCGMVELGPQHHGAL